MTSQGATDLSELLRSTSPVLHTGTFVFGHIPARTDADSRNVLKLLADLPIQSLFREDEGWIVIVEQSVADQVQLQSTFPCKRITLKVQSSLEAVGFMAAITARLTELRIGVNPVSGYFHDHLFVPEDKAEAAMEMLKRMATEAS